MGSQSVTKLVTNRIAISRTVLSSAEVHGAEVAQPISDILFPNGVADTITGLYELAGRAELADRVRPTARRRAGLTEDTDNTPAPPPAAPAPAEPTS